MYKILLCHRRKETTSIRELQAHWKDVRSGLVQELKPALGSTRYAQLHRLPRRNLLYLGIRATRSWLVTTFLAVVKGRRAPRHLGDPPIQREERWDVIDELWFPSRDALTASLTEEAGTNALGRLEDDQKPYVRRTAVVIAEEFECAADPTLGSPRITTMFCIRRIPGMTREVMLDYWGTSHRTLALSLQSALKYRRYDQMHVRGDPELTRVADSLGGSGGEAFDGVASLAYGSQWELVLGFLNPRTQIANLKLVSDEITFVDGQRSALVFGEQHVFGQ